MVRYILSALVIGFYGWLHFAYFTEHQVSRLLSEEGAVAIATATDPVGDQGGYRDQSDSVHYVYRANGQVFSSRETVWDGTLDHIGVGDTFPIRYASSDPTIARLSGGNRLDTLLLAMAFFDLCLIIAIVAIMREFSQSR